MKIFRPTSLILHMTHLVFLMMMLLLFWLLLQMMNVRMKIHLRLLSLLQHQLHFLNGSVLQEKQLVILSVILKINNKLTLSIIELHYFWLKFQRIMIQRQLKKLLAIQIGIQR